MLISCLPFVVWPFATPHPFRDGAPSLVVIEAPPTFWSSLRLLDMLRFCCLLVLSRSCVAFVGHRLSPRKIEIVSGGGVGRGG